MSLENRVAVITGASGVLGSVVTRELALRGVTLALLGRDTTKLVATTTCLSLPDDRLLVQDVNLLDPAETRAAAEAVATKFRRIDILLHLVGGWTGGRTICEVPADDLVFMLNQHVWTSFHVTQAFIPYLVKNGWGRVIMITSPTASRPNANGGPYAIGKSGQEALMMTLSRELKGSGVTANLLQARTIDIKREKVSEPSPENASWTTPEELTSAILYLTSDDATVVNGARIPLFGDY
jgi:NAD(P)-dependent dehydrogenase (short-subunit alcohol dehydrogenase family)